MSWQTKRIEVDLDAVIERDREEFLDLIADKAFGTVSAEDIGYAIGGFIPNTTTLFLVVTAYLPEEANA